MYKTAIAILAVFLFVSCSNEDDQVILFETDFEDANSIAEFIIPNDGSFDLTLEEKKNGEGCLVTHSSCSSLMYINIGPLDADYEVSIEGWIKTQYGASIRLTVSEPEYEIISIETSSDYEEMRKWNYFTAGDLDLKEGQIITLTIDPSNTIFATTWYDDIKVIGNPK